jgi:hypothetical protein
VKAGLNVNTCDERGRPAIFEALKAGFVETVELAVALGTDVRHRDKEGLTVMHMAAWCAADPPSCSPPSNACVATRETATATGQGTQRAQRNIEAERIHHRRTEALAIGTDASAQDSADSRSPVG